MAWLGIWCGISNTCGGMRSDRLGKNRENDKELDEDCVEKEFPLARVKSYINGGGSRKDIVMGNCSINVWDGSKLKFDSRKAVHIL